MRTGLRRLAPLAVAIAAGVVDAGPACAGVALPPVNLGDSTFQDGIAGPGWLFQQTLSAYHASTFRDANGRRSGAPPEVASVALLAQASYLSEHRVLGAYRGAEAIVPFVHARMKPAAGPTLHATGAGDVFISPLILQWPQTSLAGRPFWQRLNLNVTLPTGRHGRPARLDLGSNAWLFNPHYAFTWEASPEWEISGRIHYLRASTHRDSGAGAAASATRAGDAVHLNSAISRSLGGHLRVGGSMYALVQIADDRVDGHRLPGRERVLGFGPSLAWSRGRSSFHATAYVETLAKDRTEGSRLSLRYAVGF
ncbi:phenol degradation protein [Stenotrophomonas sp. MYb238]|uniref:SphA family protein n=1 Tax=Stenotrophomonas sp. MYb238 TaxID=2040281 RepID=UPI001291054A|nr:transporter [Stenotrophomonas sp. MYb238]MQP74689.1 phenol degradation protein [Stenotrophomonas sp. MYb238]